MSFGKLIFVKNNFKALICIIEALCYINAILIKYTHHQGHTVFQLAFKF